MKSKQEYIEEYIEYLYGEEKNEPTYVPDVYQSRVDFKAGFNLAEELFETKWTSAENYPDNDRTVLVKMKDYRRPQENSTEVALGYFDEFKSWRYQNTGNLIDSGHGWFIEKWMEIPQ